MGLLATSSSAPRGQGATFAWLQRRLLWNGWRSLLRHQRFRLGLIAFLTVAIWTAMFALFMEGFQFLRTFDVNGPVSFGITELLFGLFFLSVSGLTVFSTGLLLYGNLFRHPEPWFLLSTPARADQIYAYKFRESLIFSGWSFLLLGTPLLLAQGIQMNAGWPYFVLFPLYLAGYLLLPGSVGALVCLLVMTFLTRHRKVALAVLLTLAALLVLGWAASLAVSGRPETAGDGQKWVRSLIDHLQPTRHSPPASWMTNGLLAATRLTSQPLDWWAAWQAGGTDFEEMVDAVYYLLLIWSYGLAFHLFTTWVAGRVYRRAFDETASSGDRRRKYRAGWSDALLNLLLGWTDPRTRTFVLKDWLSFRRDPAQWGQVLLLGIIILLYFANIPNLPHGNYNLHQRSLIGILNVFVVGLMMATYTSRFVFPLMSLEGRNFWILGLLPLERSRLLTSKFTYAALFTLTTGTCLVLLSGFMLRMPWAMLYLHTLTMIVIALGLAALSVGLGAYLVNVKETNPSKIATGFGGTINLLASLGFSVVAVAIAALPGLAYFANPLRLQSEVIVFDEIRHWVVISTGLILVLGAVTVSIPLMLGRRAFQNMEF